MRHFAEHVARTGNTTIDQQEHLWPQDRMQGPQCTWQRTTVAHRPVKEHAGHAKHVQAGWEHGRDAVARQTPEASQFIQEARQEARVYKMAEAHAAQHAARPQSHPYDDVLTA